MTARKVRATKSIPAAVAPRSQQPPPLKRGLVEDKGNPALVPIKASNL